MTTSASSSNSATCKKPVVRRTKSDCVVIDIDDPVPTSGLVPSLVGVKPEDVWLCQPSVAHVEHLDLIIYFILIDNLLYLKDMFLYAKTLENRHCFSPNYLSVCGSRVTTEMRATLVNWIVEIHVRSCQYASIKFLSKQFCHNRVI